MGHAAWCCTGVLAEFSERLGAVHARLDGLTGSCNGDAELRKAIEELAERVAEIRRSFDTIRL
ncbi:hypothetical protein [Nonomuraea sp. LPB2021202275-12-8]|uniref:hypothetical protein n=1 Tax=Nonomuraea sp. LPB2021202275-12-8 TaxID=3120159 RepID=UPI00300D1499